MRRETLISMVKLRQQAIADAKKRLAETIAEESKAQAYAEEADRRLLQEAEVAADVTAGDEMVEAYARWLPRGLRHASETRLAWEATTTDVSHARATLDAARAAAELAENTLEAFGKAELAVRVRKEQNELDELGSRPRTVF